MKVLVIYDISDNVVRTKLADDLIRLGLSRIQRSAFIGYVNSSKIKDLIRVCEKWCKGPNDVVHVIPLCDYDWRRVKVFGKPYSSTYAKELNEVIAYV